jgi:hypothetical protein
MSDIATMIIGGFGIVAASSIIFGTLYGTFTSRDEEQPRRRNEDLMPEDNSRYELPQGGKSRKIRSHKSKSRSHKSKSRRLR